MRRKICRSKNKKRVDFTRKKFNYGLEEPRNIKRALDIDAGREDTKWCDSMALEVDILIDIVCFEFKPGGTKPPNSKYQETKLYCVFAIKHDLIRKSRLLAGGHLIDVPTDFQL